MYADEKEHKHGKTFNCIQRAHQNTIEFSSGFFSALIFGGLQYPYVAAVLGAGYALARIQYFKGYSTGDAEKRFFIGGLLFFPMYAGLIICSICHAVHLFFPNLL